uniref:MATH domain-containing protein n=1 Tax=Daucus carota subsp. sativus TaxID=79200 RepID=A0A166FT41_DAUCS
MFKASGYTWRLILYPNGNARRGGGGHISLYLAIEKTDSLPLGWEANVTYKMFVFDHNKDRYLTIQDEPRHQIRRFHRAKKESGFDRLITLETFNAAANGYLIDDSCVFGVEVFEVKDTGIGETIKMIEDPLEVTFDWKVCEFSRVCKEKLNGENLISEEFTVGKSKWHLRLYPNGDYCVKDRLGLFLELVEAPPSGKKVLVEFWLLIKNQGSDHYREYAGGDRWYSTSPTEFTSDVNKSWGPAEFLLLSDLKSKASGFIVNDTLLIQAKVKIKTEITGFS